MCQAQEVVQRLHKIGHRSAIGQELSGSAVNVKVQADWSELGTTCVSLSRLYLSHV